eukprot:4217803-Amphidinium_carterae.1
MDSGSFGHSDLMMSPMHPAKTISSDSGALSASDPGWYFLGLQQGSTKCRHKARTVKYLASDCLQNKLPSKPVSL